MSGSSTRDWLLDKLLKMRVALTEMKIDAELKIATAFRARDEAVARERSMREDYMEMAGRIAQLSPEKQFKVVYRGSSGTHVPLAIMAVNSSNGTTTITVERGND